MLETIVFAIVALALAIPGLIIVLITPDEVDARDVRPESHGSDSEKQRAAHVGGASVAKPSGG